MDTDNWHSIHSIDSEKENWLKKKNSTQYKKVKKSMDPSSTTRKTWEITTHV